MKFLVAIVCVITGACYRPGYRDCEVQCSSALTCPSGLTCNPQSMQCRVSGAGPSCEGEGIDAPAADDALDASTACRTVEIAASNLHTCARREDGSVVCWGRNLYFESGVPAQSCNGSACNPTPTKIVLPPATPATVLGLGNEHSCAVLGDFSMWCWGNSTDHRFGNAPLLVQAPPRDVQRPGVSAIVAGDSHTCTLGTLGTATAGEVRCSGFNGFSEVGTNGTAPATSPQNPTGLPAATAIGSGFRHMCAITAGGIMCWGLNDRGQSDPSAPGSPPPPTPAPQLVASTSGAKAIALGLGHTCYVTGTNSVVCWGANDAGQLGRPRTSMNLAPAAVPGLTSDVLAISAGYEATCALRMNNSVWCWGGGNPTPQEVFLGLNRTATQITLGSYHACALLDDDTVLCWGPDDVGQHGDGPTVAAATMPTFAAVCPPPPR